MEGHGRVARIFENDKSNLKVENKKYKILILGIDGIPSHITRFIRNLKNTNPLVEITLFSRRDKEAFTEDIDKYIDDYIQQNTYHGKLSKFERIKIRLDIYLLIRQFIYLSKRSHYDIINIHYPTFYLCYIMKYLHSMASSVIVSPWGSDVLRLNDKRKKRKLAKVFNNSSFITVNADGQIARAIFQEATIKKEKFHELGWGSETIDYINEHLEDITKEDAKEKLSLKGKYLITCGYNAFQAQRHEVIIKAINNILCQLPDNYILLFPVTYGTSDIKLKTEYVNRLKILCGELNLRTVFYEQYLSVPEIFLLRRATDMFIHVQTTDAGNSSLQEYVLCGAKVVHGSWIQYKGLEQYEPLFYFPVDDIDHLDETILKAYQSDSIQVSEKVIERIQNRGWKAKMKQWNVFFMSCCQ